MMSSEKKIINQGSTFPPPFMEGEKYKTTVAKCNKNKRRKIFMGYTGYVEAKINGRVERLFSEWKSNYTEYCMDYAREFLLTKPCLVGIEEIEDTIISLNCGMTAYSSYTYEIRSCMKLIDILTECLKRKSFTVKSFSVSIEKDSLNCDVLHFHDENREKFSEIPIASIGCIFSEVYRADNPDTKTKYEQFLKDIVSAKTQQDIFKLIAETNQLYSKLNSLYTKKYEESKALTEALHTMKNSIIRGDVVNVSFNKRWLTFRNETQHTLKSVVCTEFFLIADLFRKNNISQFSASATISTKNDLKNLIDSFRNINVEKRLCWLEKEIEAIYNDLDETDIFSICISGGY